MRNNHLFIVLILFLTLFHSCDNNTVIFNYSANLELGDSLDAFNGIVVYYNESFSNVSGRNTSDDGYNLGLKYQCVEFVKRYYYEYYDHKMPNSWGHAKDFFNAKLDDGQFNPDRGLIQYKNGSKYKPKVGGLIVFDGLFVNRYGHVAIISRVKEDEIEVIQQNCGLNSRANYVLIYDNGIYTIKGGDVLGWLGMKKINI